MSLSVEEETKRRETEGIMGPIKEEVTNFNLLVDFLQRYLMSNVSSEASMIVDDELLVESQWRVRFQC